MWVHSGANSACRVQLEANTRRAVQDMVDIIFKCVNGEANALSWFATRLIDDLFVGFQRSAYNKQGKLVASREARTLQQQLLLTYSSLIAERRAWQQLWNRALGIECKVL